LAAAWDVRHRRVRVEHGYGRVRSGEGRAGDREMRATRRRDRRVFVAFLVVMAIAARALAQGAVDGFDPGANFKVTTLAVQSDGRIVVGGSFSMLGGGGTGAAVRGNIGRLNGDGTIDPGFFPGADNEVDAIALQPDGRMVVGGYFTLLG